jgi:pantoate--beta-alanine ligase
MEIVRRPHLMQQTTQDLKRDKLKIAFVPTMGALHAGHLSLVRKANQLGQVTVVSIFVNPTQFGPNEDFERYPRDLGRDVDEIKELDVDYVFAPDPSDMFPGGYGTFLYNDTLSDRFCGRSRPGHFRGVLTVVAKLLNLVRPDFAVFGQKDFQQAALIKRMVQDLNFLTEVVLCPTVRESDGLALSSRNAFLKPDERQAALVLKRALDLAEARVADGEDDPDKLAEAMRGAVAAEPLARLDYAEVADAATLDPLDRLDRRAVALVAAWVGATRLIDNALLEPPGEGR